MKKLILLPSISFLFLHKKRAPLILQEVKPHGFVMQPMGYTGPWLDYVMNMESGPIALT